MRELLERVGLAPEHYDRYPHEFSGGQRQRIGIARAIALKPKLVVADEPVSALDVSIQAQIVNLLDDLQDELGLTYVFVAHDIGVVRHISDRIAVMHHGKIVEQGTADQVCEHPSDDYTKKLLAAVPIPDPRESRARREAPARRDDLVPSRRVTLPLSPPIKPQLALTRKALPTGEEWAYEPKLDGFRAIVFVDGEEAYIQSRGGKDLARYFPELKFAPGRWVLDGELVIRDADGNLEFDSLQERIHPAQSRIERLSQEIPAELHRLRPAGRGRRVAAGDAAARAAGAAGGDRRHGRAGADAADAGHRPGRGVAGQHRGRDGEAARRALHPRQAQGDSRRSSASARSTAW